MKPKIYAISCRFANDEDNKVWIYSGFKSEQEASDAQKIMVELLKNGTFAEEFHKLYPYVTTRMNE
jgi:hypothetical protein